MTILDHLWDDTLAGPQPEKGLGKLRKHSTSSFRSSNSGNEPQPETNTAVVDPAMRVTRSIMIVKPARNESETPPASPAGATPPASPFPGKPYQRHLGFVGSLHRKLLRREAGFEPGALVLLATYEM
ncbi:hypothetical protein SSX86_032141 [Deinandra increscens subsp. villosa]|uniref:Uncharacterized protein n=1 Tax=Deinandra increscens subsp. villosa TaxID=3103831 RepID=A0AAP0C8H1_9ASTR